jgi:hypothetical protein
MRLRIDLACGQWRVIECDEWSVDGALTRFIRNGETVLIAPSAFGDSTPRAHPKSRTKARWISHQALPQGTVVPLMRGELIDPMRHVEHGEDEMLDGESEHQRKRG